MIYQHNSSIWIPTYKDAYGLPLPRRMNVRLERQRSAMIGVPERALTEIGPRGLSTVRAWASRTRSRQLSVCHGIPEQTPQRPGVP